jgi:hypothetical protein
MVFRTPDNIEWTFLETLPDYGKMHKFRYEHKCNPRVADEDRLRIRYYCYQRFKHDHCTFMLFAMKTTKKGYHVYKNGEHNHLHNKSRSK